MRGLTHSYVELPTIEMTIFSTFTKCYSSFHHQLIVGLPDSIPNEKLFNFTGNLMWHLCIQMVGATCEKMKEF